MQKVIINFVEFKEGRISEHMMDLLTRHVTSTIASTHSVFLSCLYKSQIPSLPSRSFTVLDCHQKELSLCFYAVVLSYMSHIIVSEMIKMTCSSQLDLLTAASPSNVLDGKLLSHVEMIAYETILSQ